jgi:arylsulfatase A-like enzyme
MKRSGFLKAVGLGLSGGLGALGCLSSKSGMQNVILVTLDTTRRDHLGCYGYRLPTSPNIDAFARDAIVFEDCYGTSNNTLPNHASILTGLYTYNHGVIGQQPLHPKINTLPSILQSHGYSTAAVTSVSFLNREWIGNGFQEFHSPREPERRAEDTTNVAIRLLELLGDNAEAFFLWLHYWDPHFPYAAPEGYRDVFFREEVSEERLAFLIDNRGATGNRTDYSLDDPDEIARRERLTVHDHRALVSHYDAEIRYMDHHIGRLLKVLKQEGLYDNSIVVFTADHGESFFENDSDWISHNFIYEPVVRIPLLVRKPRLKPRRIKGLVQNIDIAPTLLDWLGVDSSLMDGKTMDPFIRDGQPLREHILLGESDGRVAGIVSRRYKMRATTAVRDEPLEVPGSWSDEVGKLVRMHFDPEPSTRWNHNASKGILIFSWRCPPELSQIVDKYTLEVVGEKVRTPDHICAIEDVDSETMQVRILDYLISEREWNRESAFFPLLVRVVGKGKDGNHVASTDFVQLDLDSPLGYETELHDLSVDPYERDNIAKAEPEIARDFEGKLADFSKNCFDSIEHGAAVLRDTPHAPIRITEESIRKLRAVGYTH